MSREPAHVRSLRITDREWTAAEEAAADAGVSTGEIVRRALDAYLRREPRREPAPQIERLVERRAQALVDELVGPALVSLARDSAALNRRVVYLAKQVAKTSRRKQKGDR